MHFFRSKISFYLLIMSLSILLLLFVGCDAFNLISQSDLDNESQSNSNSWIMHLGGADNGDEGLGIAKDDDNNIVVTGTVYEVADLNGDGDTNDGLAEDSSSVDHQWGDIFISKFDSLGEWKWSQRLGGPNNGDSGNSVAVDNDKNVIVTGIVNSSADLNGDGDTNDGSSENTPYGADDVFISKFYADGGFAWSKRLGAANNDGGYAVKTDGDSNVIVTGFFRDSADLDGDTTAETTSYGGSNDVFISKFDKDGAVAWTRSLGGTSDDAGYGLAVDTADNIVVVGYVYASAADLNGNATGNDNIAENTGFGGNDIFISKIDKSGNLPGGDWPKRLGGSGNDEGRAVLVDNNDNIIVTGCITGTADLNGDTFVTAIGGEDTSYGGKDIFISKFDSSGAYKWSKRLGGAGDDIGFGIAVDSSDNIIITGTFINSGDLDGDGSFESTAHSAVGDIFVSKFDADGNFISSMVLGSTGSDEGRGAVVVDSDVIITGYFGGNADLNGDSVNDLSLYGGSSDVFITRFEF